MAARDEVQQRLEDSYSFSIAKKSPLMHTSFFNAFPRCAYSYIMVQIVKSNYDDHAHNIISDRQSILRMIQCLMILNKQKEKARYIEYPPAMTPYIMGTLHDLIDTSLNSDHIVEYDVIDGLKFIFFKCVFDLYHNMNKVKNDWTLYGYIHNKGYIKKDQINPKHLNYRVKQFNVFCEYCQENQENWLKYLQSTPIDNVLFIQIESIIKMEQLSNITCACCNALYLSHKYGKYGQNMYGEYKLCNFVDTVKWRINEKFKTAINAIFLWCKNRKICSTNRKWYKCKQCRVTNYCSRRCQKIHWNKVHRFQCESLTVKLQ